MSDPPHILKRFSLVHIALPNGLNRILIAKNVTCCILFPSINVHYESLRFRFYCLHHPRLGSFVDESLHWEGYSLTSRAFEVADCV